MENIVSIINTHGGIYTIHHKHSIHHSHTRVNSLQLGILHPIHILSIINTHGGIYILFIIYICIHHSHTRVNSLQLGILQYVPPSMGGTRYILIGT